MRYLVIGLGNIGDEYASTRHNMGFMVLDFWAQKSDTLFSSKRYGDVASVRFKGREIVLLKPSTYMNLSGNAVRYWMKELNVPIERIVVICDDLNLPFGTLRMRKNGSDGGHNGLKNIQETIGSQNYTRVRMGIGNEFARGAQVDFVLGRLSAEQSALMPALCEKVVSGVKQFCTSGADMAMNFINAKPAQEQK